jgi:hypothetical protein
MHLVTLTVTALLAGAAPAPTPEWKAPVVRPTTPEDARELPPTTSPRDFSRPPEGSLEDRRLWSALRDGTGQSTMVLARVVELAHRIKYGKYLPDLDARRAGDATGAGTALRVRLEKALDGTASAVPKEPGVYACRHVLLDLEQRMPEPATSEMGRELPEVRGEAQACAAKLGKLVGAVGPAADELEAALTAIDVYLGRATPVAPPDRPRVTASEQAGEAIAGIEK